MENFLQFKITLKEEDGSVFGTTKSNTRWSYIPGNLDSMRGAIDSATEFLEKMGSLWEDAGLTVGAVTIILTRGDGTVINEIDGDHIKTASQIINEMCIL